MLHLYIDTNIYLTFYHLSNDDLEQLKKLLVLIKKSKEITLHLPEQTSDEFYRNRDIKISDALKRMQEEKLNNQFPQICKDYPEYKEMKDAINAYDLSKSKMREKLMNDIHNFTLEADKKIRDLFAGAQLYNTTDHLISLSKTRYDLGKPPGKNKSYGDALNWETLLANVEEGADLYFVSSDKDYYSEIDTSLFNSYLANEWNNKKKSKIVGFKTMTDFFNCKFPHIKFAIEYEKELLIKALSTSDSFGTSRRILNNLSAYSDFTNDQINSFVIACNSNNQISWIKGDEDIKQFILNIVTPNSSKIEPDLLNAFNRIYGYKESQPIEIIAGGIL